MTDPNAEAREAFERILAGRQIFAHDYALVRAALAPVPTEQPDREALAKVVAAHIDVHYVLVKGKGWRWRCDCGYIFETMSGSPIPPGISVLDYRMGEHRVDAILTFLSALPIPVEQPKEDN